jgi:sulfite oxidase
VGSRRSPEDQGGGKMRACTRTPLQVLLGLGSHGGLAAASPFTLCFRAARCREPQRNRHAISRADERSAFALLLELPLATNPSRPSDEMSSPSIPTSPIDAPPPEVILRNLGKDARLIAQPPANFETPLALLDSFLTSNDRFFVRSNGPSTAIDIDPETWRLRVTGHVEQEIELALGDILAMPQRTLTAFLECSGNSRSRFPAEPARVEGTDWGNGAIGNAEWSGVPLVEVLDQAGVKPGAVDVVSQGADFEGMRRGLPIDVARDANVLLAWRMNGQELPAAHGGPVRLIVPGWGAIASTKWIIGLDVIDHPFDGFWNTDNYVLYDETGAATGPVTSMPVKSLITSPVAGSVLRVGPQKVAGFAWSGRGGVARVEVSVDGGATWQEARIAAEAGPFSWARFEHHWNATPGAAWLRSRATDLAGNVQPERAIWNAKGYQMNAIYDVPVTVR